MGHFVSIVIYNTIVANINVTNKMALCGQNDFTSSAVF